jgi:hypothetical protein
MSFACKAEPSALAITTVFSTLSLTTSMILALLFISPKFENSDMVEESPVLDMLEASAPFDVSLKDGGVDKSSLQNSFAIDFSDCIKNHPAIYNCL